MHEQGSTAVLALGGLLYINIQRVSSGPNFGLHMSPPNDNKNSYPRYLLYINRVHFLTLHFCHFPTIYLNYLSFIVSFESRLPVYHDLWALVGMMTTL
jgi:hypothetical protein